MATGGPTPPGRIVPTRSAPPPQPSPTRGEGEEGWGIAEMCSARTSESVIPMRTRQRMFPPRDGAPAHVPVPVMEGVGGGVVLPRQSEAQRASEGWGIAEMCSARTSESVIPMRAKHRTFPPRDGAPAHVPFPVMEGAGGGVVLPRQSEAQRAAKDGA